MSGGLWMDPHDAGLHDLWSREDGGTSQIPANGQSDAGNYPTPSGIIPEVPSRPSDPDHGAHGNGSSNESASGGGSGQGIPQAGPSLKRGMACTFCRRRKLRCSGERPLCTNCIKYTKVCEYGPHSRPAKPKQPSADEGASLPMTFQSDNVANRTSSMPDGSFDFVTSHADAADYDQPYQLDGTDFLDFSSHDFSSEFAPSFSAPQAMPFPMAVPGLAAEAMPSAFISPAPRTATAYQPSVHDMPSFPPTWETGFTNSFQPPLTSLPISPAQIAQPDFFSGVSLHDAQGLPTLATVSPVSYGYPSTAGMTTVPLQHHSIVPTPNRSNSFTSLNPSPLPHTASQSSSPSQDIGSIAASRSQSTTTAPSVSGMDFPKTTMYDTGRLASPPPDPIENLTERLGEFLFSVDGPKTGESSKRRKSGKTTFTREPSTALLHVRAEVDGLNDQIRNMLLDIFLSHHQLFFAMSVPRFRYRMTYNDRRRPNLAILNAMYLWAARIGGAMGGIPGLAMMEHNFFVAACQALERSSASNDRLLDSIRAAMLLGAYSFTSGRYHQGWCLAGTAIRLVLSTGLHKIPSLAFQRAPVRNPFLRNQVYVLPPPEDALELGERIHTFWAVHAIDRCGAVSTGFPAGISDADIITPFPLPLDDIATKSNCVARDDASVKDLYRHSYAPPEGDTPFVRWIKSVTLLERASKLAFLDPEETSEYTKAHHAFALALQTNASPPSPPAWLDQPKYRVPRAYREIKLGLDQFIASLEGDGISPVDRKRNAEMDGVEPPIIKSHTICLHHQIAATQMLLYDINTVQAENKEALIGARKAVALIRHMPLLPPQDADALVVVVWSMIAKVLVKELHRLRLSGDLQGASRVAEEVDVMIAQIARVGTVMFLAQTQSKAMEELKRFSLDPSNSSAMVEFFNSPPVSI